MGKMTELTVQIENKPGTLASLGEALAKAKVNILAFTAEAGEGSNRVRLTTDKSAKAKEVLAGLNLQVSESEVVGIVLKNKAGTLASAARKLAKPTSTLTTVTVELKKARKGNSSSSV